MKGRERFFHTAQRLAPFILAGLMLPSQATAEPPVTAPIPPTKPTHTRHLNNQEKPVFASQGASFQGWQAQERQIGAGEQESFIPQDFTPYSFSRTSEGFFILAGFKTNNTENAGFHLLKTDNSSSDNVLVYVREHKADFVNGGNMSNIAQAQNNPNIVAAIRGKWGYFVRNYLAFSKDNGKNWQEVGFNDLIGRVQVSADGQFVFLLPLNIYTNLNSIKRYNLQTEIADRDYSFQIPASSGILGAITPPKKIENGDYEAYVLTSSGYARFVFLNQPGVSFKIEELSTEFYDVCRHCGHIYSFENNLSEQKVWIVSNPGLTEIQEYKKGQLSRIIKPDLNLYKGLRAYSPTKNYLYFEDLLVDEEGNRAFVIGNLNGKQDVIEVIEINGTNHKLIEIKGKLLDNVDHGFIIDKLALVKRGGKTLLQAFVGSNTQGGKGTGVWELDITQGYDGTWQQLPTLRFRSHVANIQR